MAKVPGRAGVVTSGGGREGAVGGRGVAGKPAARPATTVELERKRERVDLIPAGEGGIAGRPYLCLSQSHAGDFTSLTLTRLIFKAPGQKPE